MERAIVIIIACIKLGSVQNPRGARIDKRRVKRSLFLAGHRMGHIILVGPRHTVALAYCKRIWVEIGVALSRSSCKYRCIDDVSWRCFCLCRVSFWLFYWLRWLW